MKIGIDISQIAYPGTGVANVTKQLVEHLVVADHENEYVLFFSSMRRRIPASDLGIQNNKNVIVKTFKFPPRLLDIIWNKLHILPIEWLIGKVDVFITSDWTEPPSTNAKKIAILHDLIVYTHPEGTDKKIIDTHKRKLGWVKKESTIVLCVSEATKNDAIKILGIEENRLRVIHPGIN